MPDAIVMGAFLGPLVGDLPREKIVKVQSTNVNAPTMGERWSKFCGRFEKFFQEADGRDKVFKVVDPILDSVYEICDASGSDESVLEGISNTREFAKIGRDSMGMLNIFAGIIRAFLNSCSAFLKLMKGFIAGEPEVVIVGGKDESFGNVAEGRTQQFLAACSQLGKSVSTFTYIFGFGVCRPISNLAKYGGLSLSEGALNVGRGFPLWMMANHVGGIFGGVTDMGFLHLSYNSALQKGETPLATYRSYVNKWVQNVVSISEKSFELMYDVIKYVGLALPTYLRLALPLAIGSLGCYRIWLKTA